MGKRPSFASLHGASVLIVDDTPISLMTLDIILRAAGCTVTKASSAVQALALLAKQAPDLALLDVMMPEMDGYTLCQKLHAIPHCSQVPVIFLSALADTADKVRGFEAGGADYVTKPFQAPEVLARAEHQVKIARLQRELQQEKELLLAKNQELSQARGDTDAAFGALSDFLPGQILDNRYRLDEKIGSGGFGVVYEAMHMGLLRPVAVKVFRPRRGARDADSIRRFVQEGISACRINHPNAVLVMDAGISTQGIPYLVMELLTGRTLNDELRISRSLSLARCLRIAIPVLRVLVEAERAKLVHRDIKPDNIFLHFNRTEMQVKLLDFGIAKLLAQEPSAANKFTHEHTVIGTPSYMAPERLLTHEVDARADIYSLGVVMYEMLAGQLPKQVEGAPTINSLIDSMDSAIVPLQKRRAEVPDWIASLIHASLQNDPQQRPAALHFLQQIDAAIAQDHTLQQELHADRAQDQAQTSQESRVSHAQAPGGLHAEATMDTLTLDIGELLGPQPKASHGS